jgi:hypothetical protein
MKPFVILCFLVGGAIQFVGLAYGATAFEELNLPVIFGAIFAGTAVEMLGLGLHLGSRM